MSSEENIISSETKLSAIAAVMFFSPFVKNKIKSDPFITDSEKAFMSGYLKIGFVNLILLILVLSASLSNLFLVNGILDLIIKILSIAIFIISIVSIFVCINDLPMRSGDETVMKNFQNKGYILKSYIPITNFVIWFSEDDYESPYWWLKESVLLRTSFIFGTLLLGQLFGIGILIIIAVRVVLLLLSIDIFPLSIKKIINSCFSCNPGEITAYLFAPIDSKIKKHDYETILESRKEGYAQGQEFGLGIMMQYILFLGILYLLYRGIAISMSNAILFIAMILWIIRIVTFYVQKKRFLKIPILSEIVSLVFH